MSIPVYLFPSLSCTRCALKKQQHTWYKSEVARNFKPIIFSLGLIVTFTNRWLCYQSRPLPPITLSLSLSLPRPLLRWPRMPVCIHVWNQKQK